MKEGWIKLHRCIEDNEFYFAEPFNRSNAWIDLLLLTSFHSKEFYLRGVKVVVNEGELAISHRELEERWKRNSRTISKYLNDFEKAGMIRQKKSRIITVISIVKWSDYQQIITNRTQQNTQQFTQQNAQQNTQPTKNIKNDKNNIYPPLTCACEEKTEEKPQGEQPSPFETYELIKQKEKLKKEIGYTDEQKDSEIEQFKQQLLGSEQDLMGLMKTCGITLPEAKDYIEKHSEQVKFDKKVYYNYADYRSHVGNMYSKYKEKHKRATQYDPRRGQEPAKNFEDSL